MAYDVRVLSNAPGQSVSATWKSQVQYRAAPSGGLWSSIVHAIRLYWEAADYDCVVLGGGARVDSLYCWLAALLPFRRPPCVRIDCLWYLPANPVSRVLKRLQFWIESLAIAAYVVWATREIDAYARDLKLPRERIVFIPYHHTLNTVELQPWDGGYVFSGGNFSRDYQTLLAAVRDLPFPVKIACTRPELFHGCEIPPHVDVRGYSHDEYLRVLAGCRVNVVALEAGLLHSGGQQTFLNSMALGKATIVTDPDGAKDYISDGDTGILIEPGNVERLRESIRALMQDPVSAQHLGERARRAAVNRSAEMHFQDIMSLIRGLVLQGRRKVVA